ncbi:uncharacterized protein MYCFIDRAFT_169877 [Pseudocercospora fijiensis CIRAD86]|uniref:Uncharacterized protein n=1 Tax=Pseudocercospora fijiensis (strain CIRAD86) TaxID=383855 RepID=N1Q8W1_PSEFD|nr:uncharacterized protein MYCFIDRAFT_169877 [Pseudocercospora fijiensis CIRAD86]EME88216.1 hypothetical protein MYCFIDRAFT_169877 [Pseudocercospora fijiensis CIRAD86]
MPKINERCIQNLLSNLSMWEDENHEIEHAVIADSGTSQILLICACDGREDFESVKASKTIDANGVTYDIIGTITREGGQENGEDSVGIEFEKESVLRVFFDASYRLKNQPKYYSKRIMRYLEEMEGERGEQEVLKKEKKRAKRERQKAKKVSRCCSGMVEFQSYLHQLKTSETGARAVNEYGAALISQSRSPCDPERTWMNPQSSSHRQRFSRNTH